MTDLSVAKKCDRSHGYSGNDVDETRGDAKASDEDIDKIVSRLYNTHTVSSRGDGEPPATARDTISRGKANKEEVNSITDRLYRTHTRAMQVRYMSTQQHHRQTLQDAHEGNAGKIHAYIHQTASQTDATGRTRGQCR